MKIESNKNWTTCLRLNTGDGSPRVFLLNSHFLGSVPINLAGFFFLIRLFWRTVEYCSPFFYFAERNISWIELTRKMFAGGFHEVHLVK